MKPRNLFISIVLCGFFLFLITIGHPTQTVLAQNCGYDSKKTPIPCPVKQDKKKKTAVVVIPSHTPTLLPSDTPVPSATATPLADLIAVNTNKPVDGKPSTLPWLPWLGGIAIGFILGGMAIILLRKFFGRPSLLGWSDPQGSNGEIGSINQPGEGDGAILGDDESTRFVKLTEAGLVKFEPHLSTANQVSEVRVRGYDPVHKKEFVGSSSSESDIGDIPKTPSHQNIGGHSKNNQDKIADVEVEIYDEDIHTKFA